MTFAFFILQGAMGNHGALFVGFFRFDPRWPNWQGKRPLTAEIQVRALVGEPFARQCFYRASGLQTKPEWRKWKTLRVQNAVGKPVKVQLLLSALEGRDGGTGIRAGSRDRYPTWGCWFKSSSRHSFCLKI
jgi:hypothetical protein